ncbi:SDR family oxidoreductase [Arthrobacter sp. zg-ZUI100]|uniref:SDR family oxidoreductase n=1 Tax=Arthrobacter jiangjiafuii TaxID=2817475 RepID=UPI001AEDDC7A|nr:SDR family oxidoreductase [Arthrobacter jiangjiafuii]MBP3036773.1 SDR family oxidoreductase [Arthrobacter jiangjiafuii]
MAQEQPDVAVTGATGALGGAVARLLAEAGVNQRLLARHTARLPELPGTPVYAAAYSDREHAARALRGVKTLFMVSAAESTYRRQDQRTFVDAAVEAGVQYIVYTSFMGAAPDAVFTLARDHADTEEYIRSRGLAFTFLRDCLYQDVLPTFVGRDGVIRGPAGDGRLAAVARADVARCAARILTAPQEHAGAVYTLTGPQALSFEEIAGILTRVGGSKVSYRNETLEEARESRSLSGVGQWQIDAWVSTYTAIAAGQMAEVSGDVERITGIPPVGLEDYLMHR